MGTVKFDLVPKVKEMSTSKSPIVILLCINELGRDNVTVIMTGHSASNLDLAWLQILLFNMNCFKGELFTYLMK